MYFVQSFSFSVSFLIKASIASKCPAPNRLRRVVPAPSWPCRIGIAESAAPSCPIPNATAINGHKHNKMSYDCKGHTGRKSKVIDVVRQVSRGVSGLLTLLS